VALGNLSPTSTTPIPNGDDASTSKSATITPTQDPISSTPVAAAAEPPKRKSRVLSRKTDHSVIERRRREKINERLIRLQETVPACREEATEMLASKLIKKRKRTEEEIQKEIGEKVSWQSSCSIGSSSRSLLTFVFSSLGKRWYSRNSASSVTLLVSRLSISN